MPPASRVISQTVSPELVRALAVEAAKGDRQSLGSLYDLHSDIIWRYIYRRTGDVTVTDDVTGEFWMLMVTKIRSFDPARGEFIAFAYTVAKSVLLMHYRSRERSLNDVSLDAVALAGLGATDGDPYESAVDVLHSAKIVAAVNDLPDSVREACVLHLVDGLSPAEVAQVLDKPAGTVRSALSRGRKMLMDATRELRSVAREFSEAVQSANNS